MRQRMIMDLLQEASQEECPKQRLDQIQKLFLEASLGRDSDDPEDQVIGDQRAGIFLSLWNEVIEHRPDFLPIYFPVFVILCAPCREQVNWNGLKGIFIHLDS